MKYKHCEISDNYKIVVKGNLASGHQWIEHVPMRGVHVLGGKLANRKFSTVEKAKEAIDFDWEITFGKFKDLNKENNLK